MAEHTITMTLPKQPIENADVEFKIKKNNVAFGTLRVSKGALEWTPKKKRKKGTIKKGWTEFDRLMQKS